MSQESRGGAGSSSIIQEHQHEIEDMRPSNNQGRRYENIRSHNHRNNAPTPLKINKILKKKQSNAGSICSYIGIIMIMLIVGAYFLVKYQKDIEAKITTSFKSNDLDTGTKVPERKVQTIDTNVRVKDPIEENILASRKENSDNTKDRTSEKEEVIDEDDVVNEYEENENEQDANEDTDHTKRKTIGIAVSGGHDIDANNKNTAPAKASKVPEPEPFIEEDPVVLPINPSVDHLFKAIEGNDVRMAKALIKYGVDLKIFNEKGYNALHYSASLMNIEIMTAILKSGPGRIDINAQAKDDQKQTALHLISDNSMNFPEAQAIEAAKLLVENGADINAKAIYSYTPLAIAVHETTNYELIKFLLEKGSDRNVILDNNKYNLLHMASKRCDEKIFELLIASDVPVSGLNKYLRQPIHEAAYCGCVSGIEQLAFSKKVDINVQTPSEGDFEVDEKISKQVFYKTTPLHFAVLKKKLDAVKTLLKFRAQTIVRNHNGKSAGDYADDLKQIEIMTLIQNAHQKALERQATGAGELDVIELLRVLKPGIIDYEKKKALVMSLIE